MKSGCPVDYNCSHYVIYRAMEDYPKTMLEFEKRFATEEACREYSYQIRESMGRPLEGFCQVKEIFRSKQS